MKGIFNSLRSILFRFLPFEYYLWALSKLYFLMFNLGMLRTNRLYVYPYFLDKIVGKSDVCIDIGANLGYYSVLLSRLTGQGGKVLAVEPVEPILKILRANTKNLKNVEIFPYALGLENKRVKLGNNTRKEKGFIASGSNFILGPEETKTKGVDIEFDAEMKKGSELFAGLHKCDFIKIDIEGYETVVIPEIESVILKHNPIVLMETRGENRKDMVSFFENRNYISCLLEQGKLYPASKNFYTDILFIPQVKASKFKTYMVEVSPSQN